jgi:hypothetical protein
MTEDREGRLLADVQKGAAAESELRLTGEAFKGLRAALIDAWEKTNPRDSAGREKLWVATTQLAQVEMALRAYVNNGRIAAKEIEAIRKAGEPKKRFGLI